MTITGLFLFSLIPVAAGLARLITMGESASVDNATVLPANPRINAAPIPAVLHIVSVSIYCFLGALQFLPSIRRHNAGFHRCNGRLIVLSGIICALTGLWMTHFYSFPKELQGTLLYGVRIVLGFAMIVFIVLGVVAATRRQFVVHSSWMVRAYAIGLGASTQTIMTLPFIVIFEHEPIGLTRDLGMTLAWIINLVVAELIIKRFLKNHTRVS